MACEGIPFEGYISWPYLDFGALGEDKELEGVAIVITGEASLSIGYNQKDLTKATTAYTIDGDSVPEEGMIPFPFTAPSMQFRLTFSGNQAWEWMALRPYFIGSDPVPLTTVKGGINRQRTKGAALKDSLYDLLNGYVTSSKTVVVRPGTFRRALLNEATRGLCSFGATLHTFCHKTVAVPAGFTLHVIAHPDSLGNTTDPIELEKIHFAEPMMGFLYVVAEFANEDVFHYWLQTGDTWEANTIYKLGAIVAPTNVNGLAYQATRLSAPFPAWKAGAARALADVIEPTVYNDFYYTVTDTQGDNPASGTVEPTWATEAGAQTIEDTQQGNTTSGGTATDQPDVDAAPSPDTQDRYRLPIMTGRAP